MCALAGEGGCVRCAWQPRVTWMGGASFPNYYQTNERTQCDSSHSEYPPGWQRGGMSGHHSNRANHKTRIVTCFPKQFFPPPSRQKSLKAGPLFRSKLELCLFAARTSRSYDWPGTTRVWGSRSRSHGVEKQEVSRPMGFTSRGPRLLLLDGRGLCTPNRGRYIERP